MTHSPTQFFFSTPPSTFPHTKKSLTHRLFSTQTPAKNYCYFSKLREEKWLCVRKSEFILTLLPRGLLRATFPQLRKKKKNQNEDNPCLESDPTPPTPFFSSPLLLFSHLFWYVSPLPPHPVRFPPFPPYLRPREIWAAFFRVSSST